MFSFFKLGYIFFSKISHSLWGGGGGVDEIELGHSLLFVIASYSFFFILKAYLIFYKN